MNKWHINVMVEVNSNSVLLLKFSPGIKGRF